MISIQDKYNKILLTNGEDTTTVKTPVTDCEPCWRQSLVHFSQGQMTKVLTPDIDKAYWVGIWQKRTGHENNL